MALLASIIGSAQMAASPAAPYAYVLPVEFNNRDISERLQCAIQMARKAGDAILSAKNPGNLGIEIKEDKTPVTAADHASNRVLCEAISRNYPNDGILSEEAIKGETAALNQAVAKGVNAEWTWVLDPLDGTKAFIKATNPHALDLDPRYQGTHYGVHVGLLHRGQPVLGVNYYPEIRTVYFAADGFAFKQVKEAPAERIIATQMHGFHPILNPTPKERDIAHQVYQKLMGEIAALEFKEKGLFLDSCGFKMISIAEGKGCNLYIAPPGGPGFWDVCSMLPLVQAVGGIVSDWKATPLIFAI